VDDAADKISAVLSCAEKQGALRVHLARRTEMFSAAKFMEEGLAAIAQSFALGPCE
jgi:hypothetical protein